MSYLIKLDRKEELQSGRTITYIANRMNCNMPRLNLAFNRKIGCSKERAIAIIAICKSIDDTEIDEQINYYFDKVD